MRPADLVTVGACRYVHATTGVVLPPVAVQAAFRLFGAKTLAGRSSFVFLTAASPHPAMRRLRARAVRAVQDYLALIMNASRLRPLLRLDFCLLLGLYSDVTGIDRHCALDAGLVDAYCHLAALVDAYDDLIDTPEARRRSLVPEDFLTGTTGMLRGRLIAVFDTHASRSAAAGRLIDDLAAFEQAALRAHQQLDLATGLDAPLAAVLAARQATSGVLLAFAAHVWNSLLGLPPELATCVQHAAATFGVVAQFADDVIDWSMDVGAAQNLLDAALRAYPLERAAALRERERRPGKSLPVATLRRIAPASLALLAKARASIAAGYPRDVRYAPLVRFGDDVYHHLLPVLPAIDFCAFDQVRESVQAALAGPNGPAID